MQQALLIILGVVLGLLLARVLRRSSRNSQGMEPPPTRPATGPSPAPAVDWPTDWAALEPRLNSGLGLERATGSLIDGHGRADVDASLELQLLPQPRLLVEARSEEGLFDSLPRMLDQSGSILQIPSLGIETDVQVVGGMAGRSTYWLRPRRLGPIPPQAGELERVEFLLLNYRGFGKYRRPVQTGARLVWVDSFKIQDTRWSVTIDAFANQPDMVSQLKGQGGYGFTHIGQLTSVSGTSFTSAQAALALEELESLLSFMSGQWVALMPVRGYDSTGLPVWRDYSIRRTNPWTAVRSLAATFDGPDPGDLFSPFASLYRGVVWSKSLRSILGWYMVANRRAAEIDGSIVLAQAALERMAWTWLVLDTRRLSRRGFGKNRASENMHLLLDGLGIPTEVPGTLSELAPLASELDWDGPKAVAKLRNATVHPKGTGERQFTLLALADGWDLALWYVELCLLALVGHRGGYVNRTSRNPFESLEKVPWA